MKKQQTILIVIGLIVIAGAVVWVRVGVTGTPDQIRVGYMRIAAHLPVIVADSESVFDQFTLDVDLEAYPDTPTLMRALTDDRIDVAFQVTPDAAWRTAADGGKLHVYFVAQSTKAAPIDGLYALSDLEAADLAGSVIGVFPGPTATAMMARIMERAYGLASTEYELRQVPPPLQLNLLGNGEIKALFTYEPLGTVAVERSGARRILTAPVEEHVVDPWNGGIGVLGERIVTYRPEVACAFAAATAASVGLIQENPELAATLMAELQPGLTAEIARKVPLTEYFFTPAEGIPARLTKGAPELERMLEDQLSVYVSLGILETGGRLSFLEGCG